MFLTNLQQGGDDDDLLDNDNASGADSENENEEQGSYTTQSAATKKMKVRRKRYKANYKALKVFMIEMIVVIVCIETFFTMYYIQFYTVFDNQKQLQEELNNTFLMGPQFSYTNNAIRFFFFFLVDKQNFLNFLFLIRQYVINATSVINQRNATTAISQNVDSIYQIFSIMKKV